MTAWPEVAAAGVVVGGLMGVFGVGGSSVATPLLSLAGIAPLTAIASPLPAAIPGAVLAARPYLQTGDARPKAAGWSLLGAVPATIVGALLSRVVGGSALLVASGVVLVAVGLRVLLPIDDAAREAGTRRRQNRPLLVACSAGVGVLTGLLANGGGFLLMPLYLLVFGLRMRQAVGTSLLVVAVLAIPTLATHWALGHVDWAVSAVFAAGLLPASVVGGRLSGRFAAGKQRRAFGWFLVLFGTGFTIYRLLRA
ncbi:MAG TPA: sulfite exporter TauE/SafE family protein [Acidimicrobiales bacterium]